MPGDKIVQDLVLEPGTGKALEVNKGQKLRIEQIDGGQCADFNCFNLHDYKEYFHTGRTRHMHGLHPSKGDFLWSAPPRERPMMYILEDTVGTNDVLYPRCSGFLYEYQYGLPVHTNCHDIQAEAQREYGLTPDDVHDSFNFFMHTGIDSGGRPFIARQTAKQGDHVELIALFDVLAVPNVCGADVMATSDFAFKPLRVVVSEASEEELATVPAIPTFVNQRGPADFRNARIKADRELERDPAYSPAFTNYPIRTTDLEVMLSEEEYAALRSLVATGIYGATDGEALRYAFFSWWIEKFMNGPKHFEDLKT
ncbi:MAG: urea carboxylase-associated family protein [Azospirillaceae bacterium]